MLSCALAGSPPGGPLQSCTPDTRKARGGTGLRMLEGDKGNPLTLGKVEGPRHIQPGDEKSWKDHEKVRTVFHLDIKTRI